MKLVRMAGIFLLLILPLYAQKTDQASTSAQYSGTESPGADRTVFRKKPNIAVLSFTNTNTQAREAEFGRTISAMLATALRTKTNFEVLERNELNKILTEQALQTTGLTHEKTREIGALFNVEVVLVGDVSLIDGTLHIDARLIDTKSAQVAVALYGTCQDLKQIRTVVEGIAQELEQKYLRQWMGSIIIFSEPPGAEAYLEDKFIGLTDSQKPLKITDLLEGNYRLRFIRGGYYDWEGDIAVLAKMERSVTVSLIAKPGSMNINSEPAGAKIYLDNNFVGETPMSLKTVAEGEHEIRLNKENYQDWAQKVVVKSFQPTDVKAILEVSPGTLTINCDPAGASIYFKGNFVATTPHTLTNIAPGEIVLRVEKEGYEEWTTSLLIQPNKHEILDVVLVEKVGALTILSRPDGARVYLLKAGQQPAREIGQTPILNYPTTIGNYIVQASKNDYWDLQKEVTVRHKQMTEVNFALQEKPGAIFVTTTPANARIFLDGAFIGRSPLLIDAIARGSYQITMRLPYGEQIKKVTVEPNRQSAISADFKKSGHYLVAMTAIGTIGLLFHFLTE